MGHIPIGEIFVPLQRMPRIMSLTDQKKSFFSETNTFICLETSLTRCEAFPFIYFYLKKKKEETLRFSTCIGIVCVCVLGSLNKLIIYRKWFLCSHTFDSIEICSENRFVCIISARLLEDNSINRSAGPKFYFGTIVHVWLL